MAVQDSERKLGELILYVSAKCANDPYFGQIKLNKILFFSDFTAYATNGKSITGAEYQHLDEGPAVYRMLPVQNELIDEGALAIQHVLVYAYFQKRPVNLREPDLTLFTGSDIAGVDAWIERLRGLKASEASKLSHETAAWALTSDREIIDPRSVFIGWSDPSDVETRRGRELAAQHGLLV